MAWWNTVPNGSEISRADSYRSRVGSDIHLPVVDDCGYMVDLLFEAGTCSYEQMVCKALTWGEIESWLNVTELSLSQWEKQTIKQMSRAYASESNIAKDESARQPSAPEPTQDAVASKMSNMLARIRMFTRKD